MKILLDNGHGFDTPGKRSPDGHFREYAYNRYLAFLIRERLSALGLDLQTYQVHARCILLDTKTGYRSQFLPVSGIVNLS